MAKSIFDIGKKVNNDGMTPDGQLSADEFNVVVDTVKGHDIGKFGCLHYDTTNNRYIVFASEESKDAYLQDPTLTDLVLGSFDAPFNYSASITLLTPSYNAVFFGGIGNYLDFTFDIKNKEGNSTGENVNVTYTFIRNATKRVVTETRRYGESVHFNIDEHLLEGTNTIIIGVTGQTTLAATTAALTYQVVNLSYSDDMDIAKVYNLSQGKQTLEVFFSVTGYGTKVVEWFLDGVQLDFVKSEDEVVDLSSQRTKYIELSNLTSGVHTLQSRAYTLVNGEKFYTDTLYREILVNNGDTTENYVAVASNIPISHGIVTEENPFQFYGVEQYIPYDIRFATMKTGNVSVSLDDVAIGTLVSNAGVETNYTITSTKSGSLKLVFSVDGTIREFQLSVNKTSLNIEEITTALSFDFRAIGKSNNSVDKDVWSYENYTGTFDGFQWNASSGWVDNALLISEGASFSIDIAPLANDATNTGKTLEFEFSTRNVNNDDAVVCDLTTDGKGLLITASEARMTSAAGEVVSTRFKAGEVNRISFVINKKSGVTYKGLVFIYVNGILSGAVNYGSADNFISDNTITFTGTEDAQVELRAMRFYDTALSADNALNNYILYRDTLNDMMEVYYRNAIYAEGTQTFSPDAMLHRLPVMVITGDIPTLEAATSTSTQILVDIDYTNEQDPTKNFRITNAALRIQGTSSLAYPRKNYRFYTRKEESTLVYNNEGKLIKDKLYSFKDGAQPVDCWCLKADYAESSGTHNTGIARLWNNAMYGAIIQHKNVLDEEVNGYALRTRAQVAALNAGYEYDVRTTIDGFPIVVFYRQNAIDTNLIFLGKYNFNNDKSTPSVFGFENIPNFDNSRMQCWETRDNGNPLGLFTDISKFDTDWSEAFESRYPDTKTPILTDLKAFSIWLNKVSQSDFATQKWAHFDVYKVAAYYCYLMRFGAVDQPVKNAFLTSEDGEHFYFINYDNDTINGLINTGRLALDPTVNRDTIGSDGEYVYAGHDSVLWNKLTADAEFMEIVPIVDNALYSAGLRYDKVIEMFNDEQADKWVERVYNQDAEYKYLLPYVNQATNNLFMLQGSRSSHRSWWLSKRFALYDSIFLSGAYRDRNIAFRCLNDTPKGQKFTITAATRMGYGYGLNNGAREVGIELEIGDSHTFTTTDKLYLGDVVKVFAAANLEALDLSEMTDRLTVIDCSAAADPSLGTKMKRLIVGGKGKVNTELASISGINVLSRLQMLNVKGCQNITSLDLTKQKDFRKLYAAGSGVASVDFAAGAPVDYVEFPSAMMSLNFNQLPYLTLENIVLENGFSNINQVVISECPNLSKDFNWVYTWYKNKTISDASAVLEMDGIDWTGVDYRQLIELSNVGTLKLKGKVFVSEGSQEIVNAIKDALGDDVFNKKSDFYVQAPDGVYISGPSEVIEGFNGQFTAAVFSDYQGKVEWSIISGGTSYQSIDQNGLLTTKYQGSARTITIQAVHTPTQGMITEVTKDVSIVKQIHPTGGTINGGDYAANGSEYTLSVSPSDINTEYSVAWSLSGAAYDEGSVSISSQNNEGCTLAVVGGRLGTFNVAATVTNIAGGTFTVTKSVQLGVTLTIVMKSTQDNDTTIAAASATVVSGGKTYTVENGGSVFVSSGTQVSITFSPVNGYKTPNNIELVMGSESETVTVTYKLIAPPVISGITDLSRQNIYGESISVTTANCYVVSTPGTYAFPLVYGNAFVNGKANASAYTKVEGSYSHDFVNHLDNVITSPFIEDHDGCIANGAELSMADTDGVFSNIELIEGGNSKYIKFVVNSVPTTGANGVISVLDVNNVVMWSWHIWVWLDDLTPVEITNETGVKYNILPVNLATKKSSTEGKVYNWFYQWGRPTPMLPPDDYNSTTNATNYGVKSFAISSAQADTYGVGIQNPQMFYKSRQSLHNWFGSTSYYNLWDANCISVGNSDNTVIKTVYDPCPAGFKMPNGNTFTYFSTSNTVGGFNDGWHFKRNAEDTVGVFFPASGCRVYNRGSLSNVGSYGYVWLSSAKNQEYIYNLILYSDTAIPQNSNYRASSASVRPVQE